ncbi:Ribokinase-like protein [Coniochaeta ligniaria NRRL 30616]|uniref:Ribokinase-like protein n=1 Tax=Coniochaeta ligniaria NRRL 30616 TaxID=1408157 RepID=A0A1J7J927_9PEZI|nr:Ribokinase-like protein [Coniochaeta ligniaria NRRL 30616]
MAHPAQHLILVGACYLDTVLNVPHFPEEDSKLRATSLRVRRGGNCPNTLEVLQQLLRQGSTTATRRDVVPHLVSCLPAAGSAATAKILSSFGDDTLADFSRCLYRRGHAEPASCYIIQSQAAGTRTIVNYNDLPEMTVQELGDIADGFRDMPQSWWHFEGRIPGTTLACIRYLRRVLPECRTSVEVEKPGRDGLRELAAAADVVFYSRAWAESQGYESADACLRGEEAASKSSLAFCTWGAQGACALSPEKMMVQRPIRPTEGHLDVVDTIGAGDTFIAGVLFGLLCHSADWNTEATLRFAVDLATQKVQMDGFAGLGAVAATYSSRVSS